MNSPASPRHPFKAVVAIAAMFAVVHGVCAQADTLEPDVAHVNVVGQMGLHQACPDVDANELADELSTAWDDADKPSAIAVTFKVQRHHVFDVAPETDSLRTSHRIRHAVHGLSCDGGDDQAHGVRFVVRFVDGDRDAPRVATISEVPVDAPAGR